MIDCDDCGIQETIAKWPFVERVDGEVEDEGAYDVVVACRPHGPLAAIERAMKPQGVLLVNDAVALAPSDDLVEMIRGLPGGRVAELTGQPGHPATSLLQSLFARFEVIEEKKLGGTLLRHLLHAVSYTHLTLPTKRIV